ncbi:MAG: DinB family protein [Chloroflexi bacterium]|nr:DinB family protein [Chloroflexota bacterium]
MSGDAIELARHRAKLVHQQILKAVDGLTDDQLAWRPVPRAHSLGWTLWHLARGADAFQASVPHPEPRPQIWQTEGLADKWSFAEALMGTNGLGTGVDDDVAATLQPPPKGALVDYAKKTFGALDAIVDHLDEDLWCREHISMFFDGPATVGRSVIAAISHDSRHLGEMEYIKGLMGLRGTVTR